MSITPADKRRELPDEPGVYLFRDARGKVLYAGKAKSIHLAQLPEPSVDQVPDGRGVLVEVLRVGVDGTDKEINEGLYGAAPPGQR